MAIALSRDKMHAEKRARKRDDASSDGNAKWRAESLELEARVRVIVVALVEVEVEKSEFRGVSEIEDLFEGDSSVTSLRAKTLRTSVRDLSLWIESVRFVKSKTKTCCCDRFRALSAVQGKERRRGGGESDIGMDARRLRSAKGFLSILS